MPGYSGPGQAKVLYENRQAVLFQNEAMNANVPSVAFDLRRTTPGYPFAFSIEAQFSAAPGAYQLNVEASDSDGAGTYVAIGQLGPGTSALNANNVSRLEITNSFARFVRVTPIANPNNVTGTVTLTR